MSNLDNEYVEDVIVEQPVAEETEVFAVPDSVYEADGPEAGVTDVLYQGVGNAGSRGPGGADGVGPADSIGDGRYAGVASADGYAPTYDERLRSLEGDPVFTPSADAEDAGQVHKDHKHDDDLADNFAIPLLPNEQGWV